MGFFKNMKDELGTKTGKAIGNKLYGRFADDYKIGVNENNSAKSQLKLLREQEKIDLRRHEREMDARNQENMKDNITNFSNLLDNIKSEEKSEEEQVMSIEFDPNDINGIIKSLGNLSAYAEMWNDTSNANDKKKKSWDMRSDSDTRNMKITMAKFDMGLMLLKTNDNNNPMIGYFEEKRKGWK